VGRKEKTNRTAGEEKEPRRRRRGQNNEQAACGGHLQNHPDKKKNGLGFSSLEGKTGERETRKELRKVLSDYEGKGTRSPREGRGKKGRKENHFDIDPARDGAPNQR